MKKCHVLMRKTAEYHLITRCKRDPAYFTESIKARSKTGTGEKSRTVYFQCRNELSCCTKYIRILCIMGYVGCGIV